MTRQDYNYKILEILKNIHPEFSDFFDKIKEAIDTYPYQRFGQLICNYICWDYRNTNTSEESKQFLNTIFPINYDPFFEESSETYDRLSKVTDIKIINNLHINKLFKDELLEKYNKQVYFDYQDKCVLGTLIGYNIADNYYIIKSNKSIIQIPTCQSITLL
jgi:hypothetical protein